MVGETRKAIRIVSDRSRSGGITSKKLAEYTESELLKRGAQLISEQAAMKKRMQEIESEISAMAREYGDRTRTYCFTSLMLKNEIARRGLA